MKLKRNYLNALTHRKHYKKYIEIKQGANSEQNKIE